MSSKILKLMRLPSCLLLALIICSACGLIYKQNIQQGNALEQDDLDELYIGMNKRQVSFVLGTPAIHDPFQQQRWDYVQTFSRRGGKMTERVVTLRFEEDLLVEIIGANQSPSAAGGASADASTGSKGAKESTPDPNATTLEAARKDIEPDIKGLGERKAKDRKLDKDIKAPPQTAPDDAPSPDTGG